MEINHRILWSLLMFLHCVNPHINVAIQLAHWILPQVGCGFRLLHPIELLAFLAEVFVVLDVEHFHWFSVVVHAQPSLSVVEPPVKRTLDALLVDDFATDAQVRS